MKHITLAVVTRERSYHFDSEIVKFSELSEKNSNMAKFHSIDRLLVLFGEGELCTQVDIGLLVQTADFGDVARAGAAVDDFGPVCGLVMSTALATAQGALGAAGIHTSHVGVNSQSVFRDQFVGQLFRAAEMEDHEHLLPAPGHQLGVVLDLDLLVIIIRHALRLWFDVVVALQFRERREAYHTQRGH